MYVETGDLELIKRFFKHSDQKVTENYVKQSAKTARDLKVRKEAGEKSQHLKTSIFEN